MWWGLLRPALFRGGVEEGVVCLLVCGTQSGEKIKKVAFYLLRTCRRAIRFVENDERPFKKL